MAAQQAADSRGSREEIVIVDLESDEAAVDDVPATMQRQDSLYMAATRAADANHHGQVVQYIPS